MIADGVLLVNKPQEWTSHDVCGFLRKRFRINKVGHAGTLDPLATGLLVVLLGQATKLSNRFSSDSKEYCGTMELGVETDSQDRQGKVLQTAEWKHITLADVKSKLPIFTGAITQIPPMVSAVKHQGIRLYKLARQGVTVEREGRQVMVHRFDLYSQEGPFIKFAVEVSKGTYVRTLVHDLGKALGCNATLAQLERTKSGGFDLRNSVTIDDLKLMEPLDLGKKVIPIHQLRLA